MSIKYSKIKPNKILLSTLLFTFLALGACGQEQSELKTAQPGKRADLEKLATEFREEAKKVPLSPNRLPPEKKKQFIDVVFNSAGFSYKNTLHHMVSGGYIPNKNLHDDLAELLLYPVSGGVSMAAVENYYPHDEYQDIKRLKQQFINKEL